MGQGSSNNASNNASYRAAGKSLEEAIYGLECLLRFYEDNSCHVILTSNENNTRCSVLVTSNGKRLGVANTSYNSSNKLHVVLYEPSWKWGDGYIP